jgi:hypothetical protein
LIDQGRAKSTIGCSLCAIGVGGRGVHGPWAEDSMSEIRR